MAVQEVLRALGSDLTLTNQFSLEFRKVRGRNQRGIEIFWLLPPTLYDVRETTRGSYTPTLTSGYVTDYGNEAKEISVEGECHFYYVGVPINGRIDTIRTEASPEQFLDGYTEWKKLRYMTVGYRDYTLSDSGRNPAQPFFTRQATALLSVFQQAANDSVGGGRGALYDEIQPVWHSYDHDDHFLVRIEEFRQTQGSDDPMTIRYSMRLLGFRVDDLALRRSVLGSPRTKKVSALEQLASAELLVRESHEASRPETITVPTASGGAVIPGFPVVSNLPVTT